MKDKIIKHNSRPDGDGYDVDYDTGSRTISVHIPKDNSGDSSLMKDIRKFLKDKKPLDYSEVKKKIDQELSVFNKEVEKKNKKSKKEREEKRRDLAKAIASGDEDAIYKALG